MGGTGVRGATSGEIRVKGLEAAMRRALQGPGGSNPRQRQRIYDQARKALVNGLVKQGRAGTQSAVAQGRNLERLIIAIEREFQGAAPAAGAPRRRARTAPEPHMHDPQWSDSDLTARREAPSLDSLVPEPQLRDAAARPRGGPARRRRSAAGVAPEPLPEHFGADFGAGERSGGHHGRQASPAGKRRWPIFSLILVTALAIAFLGIGVVWVVVGGILQSPAQRDTSVPNPPATINSEDFAGRPSPDGAFSGDWIDVFVPRDLSRVTGGDAALVDLVETDNRDALRIVSRSAAGDGEALFTLGPGLLQTLDGRPALVAMTLRSATETPTQIYVRCLLPDQGDCGRHRFDVNYEAGDVVFSLDLPAGNASQPAYLAVNSDVTGAGNGIDIYGIRVRPQSP